MLVANAAEARVEGLEHERAEAARRLGRIDAERREKARQLLDAKDDVAKRRAERALAALEERHEAVRRELSRVELMLEAAKGQAAEAEDMRPLVEAAAREFAAVGRSMQKNAKAVDDALAALADACRKLRADASRGRELLRDVGVRKVDAWDVVSDSHVAKVLFNATWVAIADISPGHLKPNHRTRERYAEGVVAALGGARDLHSYLSDTPPAA